MGRKKKGECSREAILKQVDLACKDNELDQESKMKKNNSKKKAKETDCVQSEFDCFVEAEAAHGDEITDEVFNKDCVEYEDDIMELTRLMSLCDVKEDEDEYDEQLNLAGIY